MKKIAILFLLLVPISFLLPNFVAPDWRYFYQENIITAYHIPQAWDSVFNTGIGTVSIPTMWIDSYLAFTLLYSKFGLGWSTITYIFFFLPILSLSIYSGFLLGKLFNDKLLSGIVGALIYASNTYILLIVLGGQFGVALAYSLFPLVFLFSLEFFNNSTNKNFLKLSLLVSLLMLFDLRLTAILLIVLVVYLFFLSIYSGFQLKRFLYLILSLGIVTLIHSFWILPLVAAGASNFPTEYFSLGQLKFFSFAFFENSISLLHPNWPENIFGKVYFMRSEFLILPVLAFSSLLFKTKKGMRFLLMFVVLTGLIGAFLAKGSNEPLVIISNFVYSLPGFEIFRDPTKWYVLIALSYSALIPYSIFSFVERYKFKSGKNILVVFVPFIIFWVFLNRGAIFHLNNTNNFFHNAPVSYVKLKDFLHYQNQFYRTLWIPEKQYFAYFSNIHPAVSAYEIFKSRDPKKIVEQLTNEKTFNLLRRYSIKYIIVPEDTEKKIFLTDRKYDNDLYIKTVNSISKIPETRLVKSFGKIQVFETSSYMDRFYTDKGKRLEWSMSSPTLYKLTVHKNTEKIIFSEKYNSNWELKINNKSIQSENFQGLNSFDVSNFEGNGELIFGLQKFVNVGVLISAVTLVGVILFTVKK